MTIGMIMTIAMMTMTTTTMMMVVVVVVVVFVEMQCRPQGLVWGQTRLVLV